MYIPNKFRTAVRNHCGAKETQEILLINFCWSATICDNIEWELQSKFISDQSYFKKKTIKKCIYNWLAPGKKNYWQPLMFSYCNLLHNHLVDDINSCSVVPPAEGKLND